MTVGARHEVIPATELADHEFRKTLRCFPGRTLRVDFEIARF